jgi:hypothetical protein
MSVSRNRAALQEARQKNIQAPSPPVLRSAAREGGCGRGCRGRGSEARTMAAAAASGGICRQSTRRVGKRIPRAGAAESAARCMKCLPQAKRRPRFFSRNPQAAPLPLPPPARGGGWEFFMHSRCRSISSHARMPAFPKAAVDMVSPCGLCARCGGRPWQRSRITAQRFSLRCLRRCRPCRRICHYLSVIRRDCCTLFSQHRCVNSMTRRGDDLGRCLGGSRSVSQPAPASFDDFRFHLRNSLCSA